MGVTITDDVQTETPADWRCPVVVDHSKPDPLAPDGEIWETPFIGVWQTPITDFTDVLDEFHSRHYTPQPGVMLEGRVDPSEKDSLDRGYLRVTAPDCHIPIYEAVQACLEDYLERYPWCNQVSKFVMGEGYNVQMYSPGAGYHALHCERSGPGYAYRHLSWSMYLNDIPSEDGGATEFPLQRVKVQPRTGQVVIFPVDWMFPHRGGTTTVGNKYLMTGWYVYHVERQDSEW